MPLIIQTTTVEFLSLEGHCSAIKTCLTGATPLRYRNQFSCRNSILYFLNKKLVLVEPRAMTFYQHIDFYCSSIQLLLHSDAWTYAVEK